MNLPTPAIVAQSAVRRLPRAGLALLCLAYLLPGFIGRDPWRSADINAFGYMLGMAQGGTSWLTPVLAGYPAQPDALLPYWLGALAIQWGSPLLAADAAARIPFVLLLALALAATWQAVYGLARTRQAQPVVFAFGGEAQPADYARAIADGGLLALIACLGLAMLAHETSPALAQLAFSALAFSAVVDFLRAKARAAASLMLALGGLALSGAPAIAVLLGLGSSVIVGLHVGRYEDSPHSGREAAASHGDDFSGRAQPPAAATDGRRRVLLVLLCTAVAALLATGFDLWRWRIQPLPADLAQFKGLARLLLWFGWPATPLAIWTLWRWRRLWRSPHLALPLWLLSLAIATALLTTAADRSLLLGLPALAALAAFALPTLSRTVTAVIDWFTLLFFSGWALVVWVVWLAMQTGFPAKPAANVARLAPGYTPEMSWLALVVALAASLAWVALVRWRVGRHRAAIWKSLVLPAGGATLGWVLVMTLLLGPLNYSLSNTRLVRQITAITSAAPGCAELRGLGPGLVTALRYHSRMRLETVSDSGCSWLLAVDNASAVASTVDDNRWSAQGPVLYGPRGGEGVQVYRLLASR